MGNSFFIYPDAENLLVELVERYNGADILKKENDGFFHVEGSLIDFKTIESCRRWIDEVNTLAVNTEFRDGKFVNKNY